MGEEDESRWRNESEEIYIDSEREKLSKKICNLWILTFE